MMTLLYRNSSSPSSIFSADCRQYVATLGDRTRSGETLGDEDAGLEPQIVICVLGGLDLLGVVEVDLAVPQFGVVDEVLLRPLACCFGHAGNRLALLLGVLDLLQHDLHSLRRLMEIVVELGLDKIVDELIDGDATGR